MVETSLKPQTPGRRWRAILLTLLAVGFMLALVLTGKLPETRQLAKFEARGVLAVPLQQVRRIELRLGAHTATFVRRADHAWVRDPSQDTLDGELQEHLNAAVFFIHASAPVRVLERDASRSTPLHEFGLEQPRCTVRLSDGQRLLVEASFGAYNPQALLQYMRLEGDDALYLMSRFVGQAWEHLGEHLEVRPATP